MLGIMHTVKVFYKTVIEFGYDFEIETYSHAKDLLSKLKQVSILTTHYNSNISNGSSLIVRFDSAYVHQTS